MNRNRFFLISVGCLFIICSYLMEQPVYLIVTGLAFVAAAFWKPEKSHNRFGRKGLNHENRAHIKQ